MKKGNKATRDVLGKTIRTVADIIGMQPVYFGETEKEKQERLLKRDKKKMKEYTGTVLTEREEKRKKKK